MGARLVRRDQLGALALGTGLAVVLAAVAMILLGSTGEGSTAVAKPAAQASAPTAHTGIPQRGLTLGDPGAKVELVEFGDLTCPICKQVGEEILPKVIRDEVATGKAKLSFRNVEIMSGEATPAGAAAFAAGEQGHGWDFVEAFFARQRKSRTGYVDAAFLESVATAAGVPDMAVWRGVRNSAKARASVETTKEATAQGLLGVPTFAVRGPGTQGLEILEEVTMLPNDQMAASLEGSIEAAGSSHHLDPAG